LIPAKLPLRIAASRYEAAKASPWKSYPRIANRIHDEKVFSRFADKINDRSLAAGSHRKLAIWLGRRMTDDPFFPQKTHFEK
jgi:hypothetical protein